MATETNPKKMAMPSPRILIAVIAAILVLMFVFFAGLAAGHFSRNFNGHDRSHRMMKTGNFGPGSRGQAGLLGDNQDIVTGAVTNVSGDSFTVAGGGTTTQVSTSSSTQFKGASSVKVNDTVIAAGTKNGSTLQASRVVINPLRGL